MNIEQHNFLTKSNVDVRREKELPRYDMQTRYGSMFSKAKDIRVYSYFCDAILFADGVLWREGFRYADLAASYGLDVVVQIAEDGTCSIVHGDI